MPGGRTYVDNAYNRSAGRVGLPVGSAVISSRSSSRASSGFSTPPSSRTYVDNAYNRSAGRVGLPLGSSVISSSRRSDESSSTLRSSGQSFDTGTSGYSTSSQPLTYVDNSQNRRLGRVGMAVGTAVHSSKSFSNAETMGSTTSNSFTDSSFGEFGMQRKSSSVLSPGVKNKTTTPSPQRVYVDNSVNRRLGRVGMPLGSMVLSKSSGFTKSQTIDDPMRTIMNGRSFIESPISSSTPRRTQRIDPTSSAVKNLYESLCNNPEDDIDMDYMFKSVTENDRSVAIEQVIDKFAKVLEIAELRKESKQKEPQKTSKHVMEFTGTKIKFEDIELRKKIGGGSFGDVHVAKYLGSTIAVKKLRVQRVSKRRLQGFNDELHVLCSLKHPNIVKFIGACVVTPNLCICMEFMKTSLFEALFLESVEFSESGKLTIVTDLAVGLQYLHENKVVHCDVKSANVLLDFDTDNIEGTILAKLTDFGLSLMKNNSESSSSSMDMRSFVGTPRYSAPEVLRGEMLSLNHWKCADVYSLSVVMFETVCGDEAFCDLSAAQLAKHVGEKGTTPEIPDDIELNGDFEKQLQKCWSRKPNERPTAEDLSSFFKTSKQIYT